MSGGTWVPTCPRWCDRRHPGIGEPLASGDVVVHWMTPPMGTDEDRGWRVEVSVAEEASGHYSEHAVYLETRGPLELVNPEQAGRLAYALNCAATTLAAIK